MSVTCPYCQQSAVLVTASEVGDNQDNRLYWRCKPCSAHVPCHPGTERPLGRLADPMLREAKEGAYQAFRAFQRGKELSRGQAFRALAEILEIETSACDFNQFDLDICLRVIKALPNRKERAA